MAVFWVVAPCSLAIALMMEAARTSETLVNFFQTTRHYNPEDSLLRGKESSDSIKHGEFLVPPETLSFSRRTLLLGVSVMLSQP
jgi:hypothetical protein